MKTDVMRAGIRFVNPGSVALPKDGSRSCAVYVDGDVKFRELS